MTDEQFIAVCEQYSDDFVEVTAEGELIVSPPNYSIDGARNSVVLGQLGEWARTHARGVATNCSASFALPNGARRSADAGWTLKRRVMELGPAEREGFWPFSPDFVIELCSPLDRLGTLRAKMEEWTGNGAQLGWLIDPGTRTVEIYRPGRSLEVLTGLDSISGEGVVDGFRLDLRPVWDPLA